MDGCDDVFNVSGCEDVGVIGVTRCGTRTEVHPEEDSAAVTRRRRRITAAGGHDACGARRLLQIVHRQHTHMGSCLPMALDYMLRFYPYSLTTLKIPLHIVRYQSNFSPEGLDHDWVGRGRYANGMTITGTADEMQTCQREREHQCEKGTGDEGAKMPMDTSKKLQGSMAEKEENVIHVAKRTPVTALWHNSKAGRRIHQEPNPLLQGTMLGYTFLRNVHSVERTNLRDNLGAVSLIQDISLDERFSVLKVSSSQRHVLTPVMSGSPLDEKVALQTTHCQMDVRKKQALEVQYKCARFEQDLFRKKGNGRERIECYCATFPPPVPLSPVVLRCHWLCCTAVFGKSCPGNTQRDVVQSKPVLNYLFTVEYGLHIELFTSNGDGQSPDMRSRVWSNNCNCLRFELFTFLFMYGHVLLMQTVPQHCDCTVKNSVAKLVEQKLMMHNFNFFPYDLNLHFVLCCIML
ncbi:hypothetical protein F2P81_013990 [Scophthalmus maximus]|uniref:Uncharacterized protein n=1 Tax=Scophthalmus maximus TaxID=52904 RepID=A0A6A4SS98_SCOMX|nr:hypothetical protein F2P81_013990 [Scophthalmus maximus]